MTKNKCEHGSSKLFCCKCNYGDKSYVEYHGERARDTVENMNRNHRKRRLK